MSAAHLLLSYSANILRPMSEQNNADKDTILAKIKRYEGIIVELKRGACTHYTDH